MSFNFLSCLDHRSLDNFKNISIGINEADAQKQGATQSDIDISRATGFHPLDVKALRMFTLEYKYLLVFRCPPLGSQAFIGILQPKPQVIKDKTNEFGIISPESKMTERTEKWFVSDYDLMCVYKIFPNGVMERKIFFSGIDVNNPHSRLTPEATTICATLNRRLLNKIQHGAQDDWKSTKNRGVKMTQDRYIAAMLGEIRPLGDGYSTEVFYKQYNLDWSYDALGRYKI